MTDQEVLESLGKLPDNDVYLPKLVVVGSKFSSGPTVISKQATKAFSTADMLASRNYSRSGEEQRVFFALMVAFGMKMGDELS